ncbi:MAG: alpha/beta fold hydrolase [Candidatus Dormibacteria bacterium]
MSRRPFLHDTGEGPALLLLHAFPLDASQWDHQVAAWSDRYRCLRPDMYGCGRSALPGPPGVSLEAYAGELLSVLDSRGVDRFSCVGLSMGGYVTLALLALAPERIRAVVLADTGAAADTAGRRRERLGIAERVMTEGIEFLVAGSPDTALGPRSRAEAHIVDPLRGRVRGWSPAAIAAVERALAERPDRTALLDGLTVPTLIVGGSEDRLAPPASLDALAARIPAAQRHSFEGVGHLSNLEAPHDFTRVVGAFLDALAQPTSSRSAGAASGG